VPVVTRRLHYRLVDVFTDRTFQGNPLAVFLDAGPLSDAQMQRIAGELNLSETVFVDTTPDAGGAHATRIFTPAAELPFAGHPTVGAACVLAEHLGHLPGGSLVLAEGAGPVPVTLVQRVDGVLEATLTAPRTPQRLAVIEPEVAARGLGLEVAGLHPDLPHEVWDCGVPFSVVAVADLDSLAAAQLDQAAWSTEPVYAAGPDPYVVCPLPGGAGAGAGAGAGSTAASAPAQWRARMFAPSMGIAEDPATGAAACAMAGWLAALAGSGDGIRRHVVHQGVEMGRPSRLELEVVQSGGAATEVRLTGAVAPVGEGWLLAPPAG
jgi:trans-2,3-dihydro-3-hydroxyanthranilate isomerase